MKSFADLYAALDETAKTNEKVEALTRYFSRVPPADAAWAATFLIGRRPKRLLESRKLAQCSTNIPLHHWIEERLLTLRDADDEARRASLVSAWCEMDERQRQIGR